jgi:HB1, ASXL, restriction endonuclease HTH domain
MSKGRRGAHGSATWSRRASTYESAAIEVLSRAKQPLPISAISRQIVEQELVEVRGKTPDRSLYSILYRKDRKREQSGQKPLFRRITDGRNVLYALNRK